MSIDGNWADAEAYSDRDRSDTDRPTMNDVVDSVHQTPTLSPEEARRCATKAMDDWTAQRRSKGLPVKRWDETTQAYVEVPDA